MTIFFTQSHVAFLFGLILGVVLIGIGVVLKFLNFGEKLSGFIGWFSKGKKSAPEPKSEPKPEPKPDVKSAKTTKTKSK